MVAACEQAGLAAPVLEEIESHFRVTLFASRVTHPEIDDVDQSILEALRTSNGLSTGKLAQRISRSERAIRSRLASLLERGLVVEVGSGRNDPRRRYFLTEGTVAVSDTGLLSY